jgi:cytochrome c oxidase subunit 2
MGPDLTHVGSRQTIAAGTLANSRENLSKWISNPQKLKPGVNMPPAPLPQSDIDAIASYLSTLK